MVFGVWEGFVWNIPTIYSGTLLYCMYVLDRCWLSSLKPAHVLVVKMFCHCTQAACFVKQGISYFCSNWSLVVICAPFWNSKAAFNLNQYKLFFSWFQVWSLVKQQNLNTLTWCENEKNLDKSQPLVVKIDLKLLRLNDALNPDWILPLQVGWEPP